MRWRGATNPVPLQAVLTDIFQPTHLLFVLVVALLVLGPKRLPEVARQLGSGLRDFRSAINGEQNERHDEVSSYEPPRHSFEHAEPAAPVTSHEFAHSEPASGSATETPADSGHEFAHESTDSTAKSSDSAA